MTRLLRAVLAAHVLLAAWVSLRGYAATQDGPSHLYAAHVLRTLASDPSSVYAPYFESNLHAAGNSLFSYLAVWLERWTSSEEISELFSFVALVAYPIGAACFSAALRARSADGAASGMEPSLAAALACPLAYNYFLYRGFFNYTIAVPLAFLALSGVVASGARTLRCALRSLLAPGAVAAGVAASLAHPAASVFLLAAVPVASMGASRLGRAVGAGTFLGVAVLFAASAIHSGLNSVTRFSSPLAALWMSVRALGLTHTWLEAPFSTAVLLLAGWTASATVRRLPRERAAWLGVWPVLLAIALSVAYFLTPFAYGGAAGLNERIPLFVVLLVVPFVRLVGAWRLALGVGFALFTVVTGATSVRLQSRIAALRDAAIELPPRGARVLSVSLDVKLGSVSADLGRRLLADLARRGDLVTGEVFCGHPAHVVRCLAGVPPMFDASAVEEFEHLGADAKRRDLLNPRSPIRQSFDRVASDAGSVDYLLVLESAELEDAFETDVVERLRATPLERRRGGIRIYRVPRAVDGTMARRRSMPPGAHPVAFGPREGRGSSPSIAE